jgi:Ion channel
LSITLGAVVGRAVFAPGAINYHRIVGAVLLYLLIALTFVSLFVFVGLFIPKAFSGLVLEDNATFASSAIYFSFVTLTTVGYGDIVPVHPVARSLCNLEAICGQLYPATLLARLVTLEAERRR